MKKVKVNFKENKEKYLFYLILFIGIFVRIYQLGVVPGGINQDEAFSGYEADSLLNYGIDSSGYHNPVYLVTWGSGMSALNSYLMIPFIKIFGLHTWVVRFPQVLIACLSLFVFYKLLKKVYDEKIALIGLFLFTINPWHIMLSRWGLDANLAPGFLLFGLYFFVLGIEKPKYYIASAFAYGLSLYCYATIWPVVPVILLLQFLYLLYYKKLRFTKEIAIATGILFVLAIPLLLFLLVNGDYINEIKTRFISIPKMVYMRDSEVSFENIPEKFYNLYKILTTQNDGLPWNTTEEFGMYYTFSIPFIVLGLFYLCRVLFLKLKRKEFGYEILLFIQLLVAVLLGILIEVNVNRINCIHISIILCMTLGVFYLGQLMKKELMYAVIFLYCISFLGFQAHYYTAYRENIATSFQEGVEEAVSCAVEKEGTIYVSEEISYPKVLLYSRLSAKEYVKTVQYSNYPSPFLSVSQCGQFRFGIDMSNLDSEGIYILKSQDIPSYEEAGYEVEVFEQFAVAYK